VNGLLLSGGVLVAVWFLVSTHHATAQASFNRHPGPNYKTKTGASTDVPNTPATGDLPPNDIADLTSNSPETYEGFESMYNEGSNLL
jgi:hypothetical protein